MSKLIASLRRRVLRALGILLPSDVFMPVSDREAEDFAKAAAILRSAYLQEWRTFETLEVAQEWRPVTELNLSPGTPVEVRFLTVIDELTGVPAIYDLNPDYPPVNLMARPLPPPPQGE
mgnify:FL=1